MVETAAAAAGAQFAVSPAELQQQQQAGAAVAAELAPVTDVTPFADQGWLSPELVQQLHAEHEWQAAHQQAQQQQQHQQQQQQAQQAMLLQAQPVQQQQEQLQAVFDAQLGSPLLPGMLSPPQQQLGAPGLQQQQQQQQQQELPFLDSLEGHQQLLPPAGLEGQQHVQQEQQVLTPELSLQHQLQGGVHLQQQQQQQQSLLDAAAAQQHQQQQQLAAASGLVGLEAASAPVPAAAPDGSSPLLLAPGVATGAPGGASEPAQQLGEGQLLDLTGA
jgi:hypothetical protein